MKTHCATAIATAFGFMSIMTLAQGQNAPKTPVKSLERPAAQSQMSGSGIALDGSTGSTRWNGATSGQAKSEPEATNPEAAENQPWMATGSDLNGPPQRFPADKTPE